MSNFTNPASGSIDQARAYTEAVLGLLGAREPVEVLAGTSTGLRDAIRGLSHEELKRAEAPGKWAINQVLQHLADSELVWGYRLRMVLAQDRPPLTGYDQDLWAARLRYMDAEVEHALQEFTVLRNAHLRLLRGLEPSDLQRVGVHAERGEESVQQMIRLYAGHDLIHLQQVARIRRVVAGGAFPGA